MRLVDGDQADGEFRSAASIWPVIRRSGDRYREPRLTRCRAPPRRDILIAILRRIDGVRRDTGKPQRRDLILHERHQRRHDDGKPSQHERGHLKAQ
jgi:hypothetical protein